MKNLTSRFIENRNNFEETTVSTDERKPNEDEAMGMAWWNSMTEDSRAAWAAKAGTGVVADAWAAFKKGVDAEVHQVGADPSALEAFIAQGMSVGRKRGY